jgi:glycosyltransferase involved in cell wall biosynthesis
VSKDKIELVPNGCDLNIFAIKATPWRPKGVNNTDLMAVFTGTHGMANGLDAALDAAKELQQRDRDDIKIVFVGQGKLKASLQARAETECLTNVVFHPPVNKEKLAGLMASADIGLQLLANVPAFYFGTSPNKFFDYISAGLPVLNNYPGWLAGMISEHKCGYSIEPEDPVAFADALEQAASNMDTLKGMGGNARKLATTQFDRNILADKWVKWVVGVTK